MLGIHHERAHRAAMTSLEEDHARERRAISAARRHASAVAAATQSIVDADLARFKDPTVEGRARAADIHKYIMRLPHARTTATTTTRAAAAGPSPRASASTCRDARDRAGAQRSARRCAAAEDGLRTPPAASPSIEKNRPYAAFRHVPAPHAGPDAWRAYKRSLPHAMQQRKVTAGSR